ncbi:serine hydrolase domain-containing protein [Psychrosphaera aestuarii]|uniref:serine hydrolase domain-containing protein n=1 Tax=Psychrosphaera aestuarii TaxID=1266052 RepID=UPI001B3380E6|nr:serine hydrolase domain-containing protein [Psychrosphaera aestuarii]
METNNAAPAKSKISLGVLLLRLSLLFGTVISLFFVPWILVYAWLLPLPNTVQAQVDEAINHGFDGMIVYVQQGNEPAQFYTGGWKDRANQVPAEPDSLFKIASISKLYVAVSIAKLANEKRLSIDTPVSEYFPELIGRIENLETITIQMMAQHRSGIPNYTNNPAFWLDHPHTDDESLAFALDLPASFAPNEGYEYSNTNYLLLSRIIEQTVGYDYYQFIVERIIKPLELQNTYGSINDVNLDDVMSGYYVGYEEDQKPQDYGMMATAEDVGIFLRALNDGSVFEAGEKEIYDQLYVYEHGGLVVGYQSYAEYHKDIDTVVVQFINTTDFDGYEWNLSEIMINRIVKILKNDAEN